MSRTFPPLDDHFPAPAGDPNYVPWWARGEYARRNGTTYTTESGVSIVAGAVVGERSPVAQVPAPQPPTPKRLEAPREPCLDAARLRAMATAYGFTDAVWAKSPNMGVAIMRIRNAARRKGHAI